MQISQKVSVVIPCYNEEKRLPIDEYNTFFAGKPVDLHFHFVDDGSNDNTYELIQGLSEKYPDYVSVIKLPKNVGKAEAVRAGVLNALEGKPDFVAYWDADLSTSLDELALFRDFLRRCPQAVLLMGSRVKLHGSTIIVRNEFRHYIGRIIATAISSLLKLAIYDTQCGAKFIKATDAKSLFELPFISTWLFDVEIIFRVLKKHGYGTAPQQIFEVPLSKWIEKGQSKVSWAYFFKLPFDLLNLRIRYSGVRAKS